MTFLPVLLLLLLLRPDQFCFLYHQSPLMLVSMASSHSSVYWFEKNMAILIVKKTGWKEGQRQ